MAGKWRIRHKLMLSVGLMVSVLALLLAGTLKGVASYRATMRAVATKMAELDKANLLQSSLKGLSILSEKARSPLDEIQGKIEQGARI